MNSRILLWGLALLPLGLSLPSCIVVKIESPSGARIKPDLKRGMSYTQARAAVARGGLITAETEHRFTAGQQPVLAASTGVPAAPPDLSALPRAEREQVSKSLFLTRYYGLLGWDEFTLLFDAGDRLLGSDLRMGP